MPETTIQDSKNDLAALLARKTLTTDAARMKVF
jgi:hypothetical protein